MKLNDVKRFSAYVRTIYHSEYITIHVFWNSENFFYRKSTIGTTIAAVEANNDVYCFQIRVEKFCCSFIVQKLEVSRKLITKFCLN